MATHALKTQLQCLSFDGHGQDEQGKENPKVSSLKILDRFNIRH